jgi:hypothetical protein
MSARLAGMAIAVLSVLWPSSTHAGFIVNTWNGRSSYPASAPVYTSELPFLVPPTASTDSQGVRSDRTQAQTFDVSDSISVESIYIGYRKNPDAPNQLRIRLVEIPDVGAYASPTELATITVDTTPGRWNQVESERYNALRVDWDDASPLILAPRDGVAGYAVELFGLNATASPVAWLYRTINTYAGGRAFTVGGGTPNATSDWVLAITGEEIPEPSTFALLGLCAAVGSIALRRRR